MRVGAKAQADFDGYVRGSNNCGYLVVVCDRTDEYGPVFINWVPVAVEDALGGELRKVQYGNPKEVSLIAFGYADYHVHEELMQSLARDRISNRQWFVRSKAVETLIVFLRGSEED